MATPVIAPTSGTTLALLIIQGIGVLAPMALDLALAIKKLFEPTHLVVLLPVLQGWSTNAATVQDLDAAWNADNPPVPTPA